MCGQRLGSGVFRLQGKKVAYAVPLLLVLAVVLVAALAFNVANLDPGGESIPPAPAAAGPPPTESYLPDPIVTQVLALLLGFIMLGGAILFFRNRTRVRAPRELPPRRGVPGGRVARLPLPTGPDARRRDRLGGDVPGQHGPRGRGDNRPGGNPGDRERWGSARGDPGLLPALLHAPRVPRHHEAGSADPSGARGAGRRPLARLAGGLGDLDLPIRGGAVQRAPAWRPRSGAGDRQPRQDPGGPGGVMCARGPFSSGWTVHRPPAGGRRGRSPPHS